MRKKFTHDVCGPADSAKPPKHVAIIMDGNGRWAQQRHLPRTFGHQEGLKAVHRVVGLCPELGIDILTLFAFSRENWQRPPEEVEGLMGLFLKTLKNEMNELTKNNTKIKFIGDFSRFTRDLQESIRATELKTAENNGLTIIIAADYGGQWDIVQAVHKVASQVKENEIGIHEITRDFFEKQLSLAQFPSPDLCIRTGGEYRLSNFLLWHLAYTELYFTPLLWPDFDESTLKNAVEFYHQRERRFGTIFAEKEKKGVLSKNPVFHSYNPNNL